MIKQVEMITLSTGFKYWWKNITRTEQNR